MIGRTLSQNERSSSEQNAFNFMEKCAHLLFCPNLVVMGSQRGPPLPTSIWWHQDPLMKGFSGSTAQVLWQDSWGMLCGPQTQNTTIHSLNQLRWERIWDSVSWVGVPSLWGSILPIHYSASACWCHSLLFLAVASYLCHIIFVQRKTEK